MDRKLDVLLVEDDPKDCNAMTVAIESAAEDFNLISITNSASTALKTISEANPDIIILDLELSLGQGTGFDVLEGIKNMRLTYPPYTVITTNNISEITHSMVRDFGGDFIFTKSQSGYSARTVVNFLKSAKHAILNRRPSEPNSYTIGEHSSQWKQNTRRHIGNELLKIGISPKNKGFNYLLDAVCLIVEGSDVPVTSALSQKYKKTPASIERAMQNAINRTWSTENIDDLLENYTAKISSAKGVPTITEFIYYYAHKVTT